MINYQTGLLVFLGAFVLSRFLTWRALKPLPSAQKAALVERFAALSVYTLLPGLTLIALYLAAAQTGRFDGRWLALVFLGLLALITLAVQGLVIWRVRTLALDRSYLRVFLLSRFLLLVGAGWLMVGVVAG